MSFDFFGIIGPYCDKMFTTKKGLVNHVGIHTGEVRDNQTKEKRKMFLELFLSLSLATIQM